MSTRPIVFRVIGDVHGHYDSYHKLIKKPAYTFQLGDFGFNYETLKHVDPSLHRVLGGNHDNYPLLNECPNALANSGECHVPDFGPVFYVRGAESIDRAFRTEDVTWWREEQLDSLQSAMALSAYMAISPQLVITHDCPLSVAEEVLGHGAVIGPSTQKLLQHMFECHQPKLWIFGHYHKSWSKLINGTQFICLDELEFMDFHERFSS